MEPSKSGSIPPLYRNGNAPMTRSSAQGPVDDDRFEDMVGLLGRRGLLTGAGSRFSPPPTSCSPQRQAWGVIVSALLWGVHMGHHQGHPLGDRR